MIKELIIKMFTSVLMIGILHQCIGHVYIQNTYHINQYKVLRAQAIRTDIGVTRLDCAAECTRDLTCWAVNYNPKDGVCEHVSYGEFPVPESAKFVDAGWYSMAVTAPRDCEDWFNRGIRKSGSYVIQPNLNLPPFHIYCNMADNGWSVIQRRIDGTVSFYDKIWDEYKNGFGDLNGEFWLGNEKIHELVTLNDYKIRFDLHHPNGTWYYSIHENFRISNETENYKAYIGSFLEGTAGAQALSMRNREFSTNDRDNDSNGKVHCAQSLNGGGWWYSRCGATRLNGKYNSEGVLTEQPRSGISWSTDMDKFLNKGEKPSLLQTMISIKRHKKNNS
ncbi:unnamed protein product [Owenia fusiformis]|uniref:Uncharacterized protein n=1 Tax=Owenia fusiformis TaxID=6347 RepID=A0A8J1TEY4_OWEFU|nr:unnamed protein product [Owenia fusiformis]